MFDNKAYRNIIISMLSAITMVYLYWIWSARNGLLPVSSDEFFYFVNSRNFFENTTLRAAFTYTGKGSLLFNADGHGFAYPLLHGLVAKVVGFHALSLPVTNIVLLLLAIVVIWCQKNLQLSQKATIAVALLTYFIVPLYVFTYMQEALHLFFAVCCSFLLCKIYETEKSRYIVLFLLVLLVASLFRNLWLFWSIGLLPLARDKKQFLKYAAVFLCCAGVSFVFTKLFWDSFPAYFSTVTQLLARGRIAEAIQSLYQHFIFNFKTYFFGEISRPYPYYIVKIFIACTVAAMAFLFHRRRERIYLAALLIGAVNLALLLVTFDAWDWREIRTMSPLFYLFTILVIAGKMQRLTISLLIFVLTSFPFVASLTSQWLGERKVQAAIFRQNGGAIAEYARLAALMDRDETPLVLLGYKPADFSPDLLFLPLRTPSGHPVRYAINYFDMKLNPADYDYVLFRSDLASPVNELRPVLKSDYYTLYQILKKENQ